MTTQTINRSRLFTGCIVSLVATAFGFAVRGSILENWRSEFQLTSDIMRSVLSSGTLGTMFLVWTSLIMFILRFCAGPIVHRLGPLGLLAACSSIAALGLLWLSSASALPLALFAAATFYGFGKTFFWPTTLGVVSERYPRGGALMLNAIAGVGMISDGTIGNPGIGMVQDMQVVTELRQTAPAMAYFRTEGGYQVQHLVAEGAP